MSLIVKLLSEKGKAPTRGSEFSAGYDLYSAEDKLVEAHSRMLIKTNIAVAIPTGHYGRVAPRSGLAVKYGISVGAGVIDEDYRGDVGVLLFNHGSVSFHVNVGDRIAQLVLERISTPEVVVVDTLPESTRGDGGFGSTGK